eukprot:comp19749_c0_seq1/m.38065 comp19749_c0_seq1/g.38065  ORF comp19749_c0_seq1/g.38065 comp19749_c0_seq1/m.38065 type:complete len:245 (+) comp19749_c0_seq1:173-907(+)
MSAYLDIDVGDPAVFEAEQKAYNLTVQFLQASQNLLGLPSADPAELSPGDLETAQSVFESDTNWSSRGSPFRATPPTPLRAGRLVIELFPTDSPLACENFSALCAGDRGKDKESGKPLSYKGCGFHRIIPGFMAQGGDFTRGDGLGGASVFGRKFKDDPNGLKLKHASRGILSMANSGKNSNSSQFFITFAANANLDGKHVVFGKVVDGFDVIDKLEKAGKSDKSGDLEKGIIAVIADCGLLKN